MAKFPDFALDPDEARALFDWFSTQDPRPGFLGSFDLMPAQRRVPLGMMESQPFPWTANLHGGGFFNALGSSEGQPVAPWLSGFGALTKIDETAMTPPSSNRAGIGERIGAHAAPEALRSANLPPPHNPTPWSRPSRAYNEMLHEPFRRVPMTSEPAPSFRRDFRVEPVPTMRGFTQAVPTAQQRIDEAFRDLAPTAQQRIDDASRALWFRSLTPPYLTGEDLRPLPSYLMPPPYWAR